jgi:hypothetical protein
MTLQRACRDDASHGGSSGARAVTFINDAPVRAAAFNGSSPTS